MNGADLISVSSYIWILTVTDFLITRAIISASTQIILAYLDWFVWRGGCKAVWGYVRGVSQVKEGDLFYFDFLFWLEQIFNIYVSSRGKLSFFVCMYCQMNKALLCAALLLFADKFVMFVWAKMNYIIGIIGLSLDNSKNSGITVQWKKPKAWH